VPNYPTKNYVAFWKQQNAVKMYAYATNMY
jgi:hypothetical protein